jgi:single-strand DNA-binding protein
VGQEPRISTFSDGGTVANFSVAYTEKGYTTKDGRQIPDSTEWFNIVAKNSLANVVQQYVHKGDKIYIEGKTKTREYVGSDNVPHKITEVIIERVELLGRLAVQDAAAPQQQDTAAQLYGQPQQTTMPAAPTAPPKDDDLPF